MILQGSLLLPVLGLARAAGGADKKTNKSRKDKKKKGDGTVEVTEIDYCGVLNRVLPPDIRALAWAPVTEDFSARFSCSDRTYRQRKIV